MDIFSQSKTYMLPLAREGKKTRRPPLAGGWSLRGAEGSVARKRHCAKAEMNLHNKNWEKFVILARLNIKSTEYVKEELGWPLDGRKTGCL